ncbi:MAG: NAD(P)-dependent oxidoreductase [Comamonadaceae bacterium]|nr:MAG: NAD(P)-dependent oxidoreductase [Comamonadaceae bacterium]
MQEQDKAGKVGVIGLGAMGGGMARSLFRAGREVHVFDVNQDAVARLASEGLVASNSSADLAATCGIVISVVVTAAQTEELLFGENGCAASLAPGSLFIMCSTVPPSFSEGLEKRLAALGVIYLDAPISGGAARAATGDITMMTAGTAEAYARCEGVLEAMAAKVYRLGHSAGMGSKVKVINQLLAGVHIAAAAEAMALGLREGVDANELYEVITHSAGNSWMFENRMAHVLAGDYTPLSAVDIFVKDLGLVLDMARQSKFPLPLSSTAHQMFMQASTAGFAREDDSAVIKIFPGIELPAAGAPE